MRRRCIGLLGIDGRRKPFLLVLCCWWIDPDRFGERQRHGRFVDETLWVFRISCRKDLLAIREDLRGLAVMDRGGCQHADPRVVVLLVVPPEEALAEAASVFLAAEATGKLRPVLERLELALGKRVVVGHMGATVRFRHTQRGHELGHRVRRHRWSTVAMNHQVL